MKKIKMSFAAIGAAVALVGAMSSAFTPVKFANFTFYRTSGSALSTAKADYQFKTSAAAGCISVPNSNCRIVWSQLTAPAVNDHPSTTAVKVGAAVSGAYNGL
jgi:hypothetical protein